MYKVSYNNYMTRQKYETKRERFLSLAEKRTNKALGAIRILSHCANKSLYDYEISEIEKIFDAIEKGIIEARAKFKGKAKKFRL